jgi:hypothetical protein
LLNFLAQLSSIIKPSNLSQSSDTMPRPKEPSEADIVFNRANLALAKHKRLVASWLPPLSNEEQANRKSADELEKDEEEMFAPVPEMSVTTLWYLHEIQG